MNYAEYAKSKGIKLELSQHDGRCWRKSFQRTMHYFGHPLTREGYDAALEEWYLLKAKLAGERPHANVYQHHLKLFRQILAYYDAFGTPHVERQLSKQIVAFVEFVELQLTEPKLEPKIPGLGSFFASNNAFDNEFTERSFIGTIHFKLSDKWMDRINRMSPAVQAKVPQTIDYWLSAYLKRADERVGRSIREGTATTLRHKLSNFKKYADLQAHITTIDDKFLDRYFDHLDDSELERESKLGYFSIFRMFVRWCGRENDCDLNLLAKLDSREYSFREPMGHGRKRMKKKKLLWTTTSFSLALALPQPYKCYCLLMLNCGFRHVDISHLQHDDVDWIGGRIVIQRQKLNQLETIPVISYKLWDETLASLLETRSDDPVFVFRNNDGGPVEDSIKQWWKRNRSKHGLDSALLNQLRKTGATFVERFESGLEDFYLGEALSTTAKIRYAFNDGEPNDKLDQAIQFLGSKFGLAEEPKRTVELTPAIIEGLKKLGVTV